MNAYDTAPYETTIIGSDGEVIKSFRYPTQEDAEKGYNAYLSLVEVAYPKAAEMSLTNRENGEVICFTQIA